MMARQNRISRTKEPIDAMSAVVFVVVGDRDIHRHPDPPDGKGRMGRPSSG